MRAESGYPDGSSGGRTAQRRWLLRAVILVALTAIAVFATSPAVVRSACSGPNPIVVENCETGTPQTQWEISSGTAIEGFATDISVNKGQTVTFKVDTNASSSTLDIYRMGYYGGAGARKVGNASVSVVPQPACNGPATDTGLVDCSNWTTNASWTVPSTAVSGIYFAAAVRSNGTVASHIFFIVRDDGSHSDLYYQTSDTTWQAYNRYGGNSLYTGTSGAASDRAVKVSYNRPFTTRDYATEDWVFNAEYPMVRWLERNGYDVSYETGVDSDRSGALIRNHKVFVSSGHDEYWSGQQRANVEAARDAGVNLAFFSGNEIFWKTRWEDDHRTLVTYKETHANAKIDPTSVWTGTWMDPRFPTSENRTPQNALSGTLFTVTQGTSAIQVPAAYGALRFWRNTSVANLGAGATATLTDGTVGYEWDSDVDNGARPAGLFDLSSTTFGAPGVLQDYGSNYAFADATHNATLYRAPSGALVFGAGTVQWAWGLDGNHDRGNTTPDPAMQQATVNLFADMHVQPAALQSNLVATTASADTIAPRSSITSPAPGTTVVAGAPINIAGTATDAGGGRVAGVEVSTDGGAKWHPAVGRENWVYVWTPPASGKPTLLSRAVDDSGNLGTTGTTTLSISALSPASGAGGVDPGTEVRAAFSEALDASTVRGATFVLRDAAGGSVPADVAYQAASRTAVLRPKAPLKGSSLYSATIAGGAGGVTDISGSPLPQDRTWSFTTAVGPSSSGSGAPGSASGKGGTGASSGSRRAGPRVGLTPRTIRASSAGIVKLRVACPSGTGGCRVALRLELSHRAVAAKTLTVGSGKARTFTLKLSRAARRELLRKGSLRVTAVAVASDHAGRRATTRTPTRLLAPRRR